MPSLTERHSAAQNDSTAHRRSISIPYKPETRRTKALLIGIGYKRKTPPGPQRAATSSTACTDLSEISTQPSILSATSYAPTLASTSTAHASDISGWGALEGPWEDIKRVKSFMDERWRYTDVHMISDENEALECSRENILKELEWLVQGAEKGHRLFLYYSGHGFQRPTRSPTEDDHMDEGMVPRDCLRPALRNGKVTKPCPIDCLCPPGANYCWKRTYQGMIRDNELYNILVKNLNGANLLAIFDCCHSGTILDLGFEYTHTSDQKAEVKRKSFRRQKPWPVEGTENKLSPNSTYSRVLSASLSAVSLVLDGTGKPDGPSRPSIALSTGTTRILDGPVYETPIEVYPPKDPCQDDQERISQAVCDSFREYQRPSTGGKVLTISACFDDQSVWEVKTFSTHNRAFLSVGLLTHAFLHAFEEKDTLTRRQLIKRMTEIMKEQFYVRRKLLDQTQRQYLDSHSRTLIPPVFDDPDNSTEDYFQFMERGEELKNSRPSIPVLSSTHSLDMDALFKL